MAETSTFTAPLPQSFGYGIIIGLGFAFALLMIFITWALKRYVLHIVPINRTFRLTMHSNKDTRMKSKHLRCSRLQVGP